jgi:hypothetical protein
MMGLTKLERQALSKLGTMGGKARAKKLSAEELSAQGKYAIAARWRKYRQAQEAKARAEAPPEVAA